MTPIGRQTCNSFFFYHYYYFFDHCSCIGCLSESGCSIFTIQGNLNCKVSACVKVNSRIISDSICSRSVNPLCLEDNGKAWNKNDNKWYQCLKKVCDKFLSPLWIGCYISNFILYVTVVTHQFFRGWWLCRSSHRTCLVQGRLSTIATHAGNPWRKASNWGRGSRDFIHGKTGSGRRVNTDIGSVERTWFRSGSLWSDTLKIKMEV